MQNTFYSLLGLMERIGVSESDSDEDRLRKTLLVAAATMIMVAAFVWGAIYLVFDEPLAA